MVERRWASCLCEDFNLGGFTHLKWLWASMVPTVVVCDAVRLHVMMHVVHDCDLGFNLPAGGTPAFLVRR